MNVNILNKCIAELKQPQPKLDYLLGMLETLVELNTAPSVAAVAIPSGVLKTALAVPTESFDEASILDAKAKAALVTIKNLAQPIE